MDSVEYIAVKTSTQPLSSFLNGSSRYREGHTRYYQAPEFKVQTMNHNILSKILSGDNSFMLLSLSLSFMLFSVIMLVG